MFDATGELTVRATASVVVGDTAYVADVPGNQVVAFDVDNGSQHWAFPTGSRIDSSPLIHAGNCYVGSRHDYADYLATEFGELPRHNFIRH